MTNHPNRSNNHPARNPKPEEIKATRCSNDMTQTQASELVYTKARAWQQWEKGDRRMHPAFWDLFCRKLLEHNKRIEMEALDSATERLQQS